MLWYCHISFFLELELIVRRTMIKENLLVLPALSLGACLAHGGKDGDLARWDLGAGDPPWRAACAGVPSVRR